MATPVPLHANRGNGRTYTATARHRDRQTTTHRRLTNGHLKLHSNFHHLDGRDLRPRRSDGISHNDAAHIAFDGSERLGLRNILPFVAHPTPHPIAVYASHPPSPTTAQHSLPGSALPPYRSRSQNQHIVRAPATSGGGGQWCDTRLTRSFSAQAYV